MTDTARVVPMVEHPYFLEGQLEILEELKGALEEELEHTRQHLHHEYATEDRSWFVGLPLEIHAGHVGIDVATADLERLEVDVSMFITKVREALTQVRWKLARNKEQYS